MRKINPLLKASVFYIIGNGLGQGMVLLGTVVFTRIMTQEAYGLYSTYYSVVSILTAVVGVNLFTGLCNAYVDYKNEIYQFRSSVLVLSTIIFSGISCVVLLVNYMLNISMPTFFVGMALVHAYSFFVVNYFNNSANMENRYYAKTILMLLPNFLQIVLSILLIAIWPTDSMIARVIGSTFGVMVCAIYAYQCILRKAPAKYNKKYWSYALRISVPSVLSSLSSLIMQQSDTVMITAFYHATETAVYSLTYNIGHILYAISQATVGAWQVSIYRALDTNGLENVKKVQKWYLTVYSQLALGLLMIAPELIKIIGTEEYWNFKYVPPFVLSSCLSIASVFNTTVGVFYKCSGKMSLMVFGSAMINLATNYIFIPHYGGIAAAYTSVLSGMILFCWSRTAAQKLKKDLFSLKYFLAFFSVVVGGCLIFGVVYRITWLRYIVFSFILVATLLYEWRNRAEIMKLIKG